MAALNGALFTGLANLVRRPRCSEGGLARRSLSEGGIMIRKRFSTDVRRCGGAAAKSLIVLTIRSGPVRAQHAVSRGRLANLPGDFGCVRRVPASAHTLSSPDLERV
jgi:hypothetical protein